MAEWRQVCGYYGSYWVSDDGRVRSGDRIVDSSNQFGLFRKRIKGRELSQASGKRKYLYVDLSRDGVRRKHRVHLLVLEAFVGPCPDGMEARHLDGNLRNNHISNLAWSTRSENAKDRVAHGTFDSGLLHEAKRGKKT
jgi:hypothetical protein